MQFAYCMLEMPFEVETNDAWCAVLCKAIAHAVEGKGGIVRIGEVSRLYIELP